MVEPDPPVEITSDPMEHPPSRTALQALSAGGERGMVLLGEPGSGKSTLVHQLMLNLATDEPPEPLSTLTGWLPLLLELRTVADPLSRNSTLLDALDQWHVTEGLPLPRSALEDYLRVDGRTVLILDGLDEITDQAMRHTVTRWIAGFTSRYPESRVVVTSRKASYDRSVLEAAGFTHYTLRPFTASQIDEYTQRCSVATHPDDPPAAVRLRDDLLSYLSAPRVQELAQNPLLLSMLCAIRIDGGSPTNPTAVYERMLSMWIEEWDAHKHLHPAAASSSIRLDPADKLELLRLAARQTWNQPTHNRISRRDLLSLVGQFLIDRHAVPPFRAETVAHEVLDQLVERAAMLAQHDDDSFGFVHRTFQEYLAATDVVRPPAPPAIPDTDAAARVLGFMEHLGNTERACILVGATLLLKYPDEDGRSNVTVWTLTQPELETLHRYPHLRDDPRTTLTALAEKVASSRERPSHTGRWNG